MEKPPKTDDAAIAPTAATPSPIDARAPTLAPAIDARGATLASPVPPSWPSSSGHDPAKPGSRLLRYRLGGVLGRGGMGEVVSARDEQIGRSVAIKRMRTSQPTPEETARFVREAKIQGRLDHPAVVPVHELWHDDHGQPFFVMKQLTGNTLGDVLQETDPETTKRHSRQRLLRAFADVCLAIEFAHTRGVVHRDLKPANIVLGDFGEVYVLDWGIARVAGDETSRASFADVAPIDVSGTLAGAILGTPGYMSPEQVRGDADLDGRSDVYALGCILFELLTLTPLHSHGQAALSETLAGIDATPSVRAPEREIAPELDAICLTATRLDRNDRYATARELGDAVQRFLDGDRDLALRKELARTELGSANDALERGNGAEERRIAIRAAARALALDPTAHGPAELVGRLMMEPPSAVPPEVEAELDAIEDAAMRRQARLSSFGVLAYFAFFPLMYWAGFHDGWYLVVGPVLVTVLFVVGAFLARNPTGWVAWTTYGLNLLVVALLARLLSPFLVGPGLAVLAAVVYMMHPRFGRAWIVCTTSVAAVLLPLAAELVGLISRTTTIVGGDLVLHMPSRQLDEVASITGLAIFVAFIIPVAAMLSRSLSISRSEVQRTLHLQAWQLRQLVPRSQESLVAR